MRRRKRLIAATLLAVGGVLLWLTTHDIYLRPLARLVAPFGVLYGLMGLVWPRAMVDPLTEPAEPGDGKRAIPSNADRQATVFGCGVGVLGDGCRRRMARGRHRAVGVAAGVMAVFVRL